MKPEKMLEILQTAGRLKTAVRHCWTDADRRESVADHSWRIALMAMLMRDEEEFAGYDMDRVIRMCLIHDLGEAFTGDIPTFEKTDGARVTEDELYAAWVAAFPQPQQASWQELLAEMKEQQTPEAKLYKTLDRIEALISHNESDLDTWLPLEYDLQYTYGKKEMDQIPYMQKLRQAVDAWTTEKINENRTSGKGSK